jgi:hypothetical protein
LEVDPDTAGNNLFSMVWGDTTRSMPRLQIYEWSVGRPVKEVVSIEIVAEGCGVYCEGFTKHYLYDLRDGGYLKYGSLFTSGGLVAVGDTLSHLWRSLVEEHLQAMRDSLNAPHTQDMHDYFQEAVDLYAQCLGERGQQAPYVNDLELTASGVLFYISRCSAHWNRNADELDPVRFELPHSWLDQWFRPELKSLFQ